MMIRLNSLTCCNEQLSINAHAAKIYFEDLGNFLKNFLLIQVKINHAERKIIQKVANKKSNRTRGYKNIMNSQKLNVSRVKITDVVVFRSRLIDITHKTNFLKTALHNEKLSFK